MQRVSGVTLRKSCEFSDWSAENFGVYEGVLVIEKLALHCVKCVKHLQSRANLLIRSCSANQVALLCGVSVCYTVLPK